MADWRSFLLDHIDAPVTTRSLRALDLWARSESVAVSQHNPLGAGEWDFTQGRWSGDRFLDFYPNVAVAFQVYARILKAPEFVQVAAAFRSRANLEHLFQAINLSPWRETGYQSGHYPVLLYREAVQPILEATAPPVPPLSKLAKDLFHAWHNLTNELTHHTPDSLARAKHWAARMHSAVR